MSKELPVHAAPATESDKYIMKITRQTVDKLGVKMYDRVSAVVAELIANSYDADATEVTVSLPAGEWLAHKTNGRLVRVPGLSAEVQDNGVGMTTEEVNSFFLKVGSERRKDIRRGDKSNLFHRPVMGRKGVGKLAPFGICERIEIWTAGGEVEEEAGQSGFRLSNFVMRLGDILEDTAEPYHPQPGDDDGKLTPIKGTRILMTEFGRRYVPTLNELERQLAQRFGLPQQNWKIKLRNNYGIFADERVVGNFNIDVMPDTALTFNVSQGTNSREAGTQTPDLEPAVEADGTDSSILSGFIHDGRVYPISGWAGYASHSYKDDLMAGIRIYCRGKIAAQTSLFNRKSGFTGEYQIRSYLVGEIHADWLDEEEDLIQTDRKDILWSDELGQALEDWGQTVVSRIGVTSMQPMRVEAMQTFIRDTDFLDRIEEAFPTKQQEPIRKQARELGEMLMQRMRLDEVNEDTVKETLDFVLAMAPHLTLNSQLRAAAEAVDSHFSMVAKILKTARIAELMSFGSIAAERIRVIGQLYSLKGSQSVEERQLLDVIDKAPWLVDPEWAPVTSSKSLAEIRAQFESFYYTQRDKRISFYKIGEDGEDVERPGFILAEEERMLYLVVVKKPLHLFNDDDFEELASNYELLEDFVAEPAHATVLTGYSKEFRLIIICDGLDLSRRKKTFYESWEEKGQVIMYEWPAFLRRTEKVHADFLAEAERQKLLIITKEEVAENSVNEIKQLRSPSISMELPTADATPVSVSVREIKRDTD